MIVIKNISNTLANLNGGTIPINRELLKKYIFDIFVIEQKSDDIITYYPNPELFNFLKNADNLHDFDELKNNFKKDNILRKYEMINILLDNLKLTYKNNYENDLFNTIYILIRVWAKLNYKDDNIDKYNKLKEYINYNTNIQNNNCLIDNSSKIINNANDIKLLIGNTNKDRINNNKKLNKYLDDTFLIDINIIKCNEMYPLSKQLDGTGKIDNIINSDNNIINLPYYLLYYDIPGNLEDLLTIKGVYFKEDNNSCLKLYQKNNDINLITVIKTNNMTNGWMFNDSEELKELYKTQNYNNIKHTLIEAKLDKYDENNNYGKIITNEGLTIKRDSLFKIKNFDINFGVESAFQLNYKLKNLGDVGMAYTASNYNYDFKTTDNISKIYFLIFNFYKFLRRSGLNIKYLPQHKTENNNENLTEYFGKLMI